jgi:Mrp family chromosome partitioning ATPase
VNSIASPAQTEPTSISFVPWQRGSTAARLRVPEPLTNPFLTACLRRLQSSLEELAGRICSAGPAQTGTIVLTTGCQRGAGCSMVSLALAAASAAQRSTLLIDGDLGRTGLSTIIGGKDRTEGWETHNGPVEVDWKAAGAGILSFLPLARPVLERDQLFARPELPAWLARLRQGYGLMIVDGGPALDLGARWAAWADVAILVCDSARRASEDWATAWDRLEEAGTRVLGIVETFADA